MTDKTSRIVAKADIAAIAALSETEKAYIAGFFDGEGSIGVYPKKSGFSLKLAFVQRKLEVLMWLHRVFGGALVTIIRGEPRNSTYYELRLRIPQKCCGQSQCLRHTCVRRRIK